MMSSSSKSWRLATLLVTVLLAIFATHAVLAASLSTTPSSHTPVQSLERKAGPQTVSTLSCGSVKAVKVVRQDINITNSSTTYSDVPNMTTTVSVPAGKRQCLLMHFSAETECTTSTGTLGWCSVIILVDGVEAFPGDGLDFAFDSTYNGTASNYAWQSNALDRSTIVGAGTHKIEVQWATTSSNITVWLGEMSLTVEQA